MCLDNFILQLTFYVVNMSLLSFALLFPVPPYKWKANFFFASGKNSFWGKSIDLNLTYPRV